MLAIDSDIILDLLAGGNNERISKSVICAHKEEKRIERSKLLRLKKLGREKLVSLTSEAIPN